MGLLSLLLALTSQLPPPKGDAESQQAARTRRERLLEIHTNEAAGYTIYRDSTRKERVDLQREPVYLWTNPVRQGGQDGAVYVWTCRGRAEILSSFFSFVEMGQRKLCHEFHSLSLSVLDVNRSGSNTWIPEAPGIELKPFTGAPAPVGSAPRRLVQMRALTHDFSASTVDHENRSWELRLLPQPLYRYQSTDPDVLDGALFAFVTSAGTDPEVLLVVEARKPASEGKPVWHYAIARFTDLELRVAYKGQQVFSAPLIPYNQPQQDPKHRYRVFADRHIPLVEGESSLGKK
jgi:hypothetical protein